MKILIAEDDLVSRKFLLKFFSVYGRCDLVVDGLEAVDAFLLSVQEKDPYDLVCLDIMMPKVNGTKVLKAIRDLETQQGVLPEKRSKVIIITALAETQFVQNAFEVGCEAYIMKPVDTNKLTEVLKDMNLI
jgi:Response regulators consisting of a CheY-like receiver domain and a winged-helix DNA-binding domain